MTTNLHWQICCGVTHELIRQCRIVPLGYEFCRPLEPRFHKSVGRDGNYNIPLLFLCWSSSVWYSHLFVSFQIGAFSTNLVFQYISQRYLAHSSLLSLRPLSPPGFYSRWFYSFMLKEWNGRRSREGKWVELLEMPIKKRRIDIKFLITRRKCNYVW